MTEATVEAVSGNTETRAQTVRISTETLKVNVNLFPDWTWKMSMSGYTTHLQMQLYWQLRDRGRKYYTSVLIIMILRDILACWPCAYVISDNVFFGLLLSIKLCDYVERLKYIIVLSYISAFFFFFLILDLGRSPWKR